MIKKLMDKLHALFFLKKKVESYRLLFEKDKVLGNFVLFDLVHNFGIFDRNFSAGDSHATAFNEGQRDVVLYIIKLLNLDYNVLIDEIKQYEAEVALYDRRNDGNDGGVSEYRDK